MRRQTTGPVDPTRIRKIEGTFSWIDHRLITQGWFDVLSREEILLYLWWTTVGDQYPPEFKVGGLPRGADDPERLSEGLSTTFGTEGLPLSSSPVRQRRSTGESLATSSGSVERFMDL